MSGKDRSHVSEAFFRFREAFSHRGDGSSGLLFAAPRLLSILSATKDL